MDGAWAGGRGFKKQPYLTVADAGGGVVAQDSTTIVTASVTPSLLVSKLVFVSIAVQLCWTPVGTPTCIHPRTCYIITASS